MPRRRSSFSAGVTRGPRRKTLWFASVDETGTTPVAAGSVDFQGSLNAAALSFRPFTIVRVRGLIHVCSDQTAAVEDPFGAFGIAVVSDQAVAAGVARLPSSIAEEFSDLWLVHQFVSTTWLFLTSGAQSGNVFEFDSRAMRKVEDGMDVVSLFENANATHGIQYIVKYRMLIKLH